MRNITPMAARRFFRGHTSSSLAFIAGMDFNFHPMSLIVVQICVPRGADETKPENWCLFAIDELVYSTPSIQAFAESLHSMAPRVRKLPHNHFAGMAIACDSTGAQRKAPSITGLTDRNTTQV